jgi:hypothetical protein
LLLNLTYPETTLYIEKECDFPLGKKAKEKRKKKTKKNLTQQINDRPWPVWKNIQIPKGKHVASGVSNQKRRSHSKRFSK